MKKITILLLSLFCVSGFLGCGIQQPQEEDINVQYFFSGKVLEVEEEYLKLEVLYTGNTNLSEESIVEVSNDVVAAAGCPQFVSGERARVVMARNTENVPAEQLQALAIYKEDAEGKVYALGEELPTPTPTLAPGENQALPTTMIDGEIYFMYGTYSTVKHSEIVRIMEIMEQAEYLGTTIDISSQEYPKEELESNCFKEGSKIYRYQEGERVNFIIVKPNELTYSFVDGWKKYRWFEDSIISAGEQDSYALGMPTPTPTITP